MRVRYYIIALSITLAATVAATLFLMPTPTYKIDLVKLNEIADTLGRDFDRLDDVAYTLPGTPEQNYSVVDASGKLVVSTGDGVATDVYDALNRGDTIIDISQSDRNVGHVLFANNLDVQWQNQLTTLRFTIIIAAAVMLVIALTFCYVLYRNVLRPFVHMQEFAQQVARGNLDIPLEMRKANAFGAYTESLDLMRDELKRAREREAAAESSKRDLVASLSHDIQAPMVAVTATLEVMELTSTDEIERKRLNSVLGKLTHIQTLSSDLFNIALHEHDEFSIELSSIDGDGLMDIIKKSDYRELVNPMALADLRGHRLKVDPFRLTQVVDNIISNSYKYAGTAIDVTIDDEGDNLAVSFRDYGPGVHEDELPLVSTKLYRGVGTGEKEGSGLGLYITRRLMERMGGDMECSNAEVGFIVRLWMRLDERANSETNGCGDDKSRL